MSFSCKIMVSSSPSSLSSSAEPLDSTMFFRAAGHVEHRANGPSPGSWEELSSRCPRMLKEPPLPFRGLSEPFSDGVAFSVSPSGSSTDGLSGTSPAGVESGILHGTSTSGTRGPPHGSPLSCVRASASFCLMSSDRRGSSKESACGAPVLWTLWRKGTVGEAMLSPFNGSLGSLKRWAGCTKRLLDEPSLLLNGESLYHVLLRFTAPDMTFADAFLMRDIIRASASSLGLLRCGLRLCGAPGSAHGVFGLGPAESLSASP
mmetsp:Transcript_32199/g.76562  ORF Transcript_32199/g.76562 Transcript_32199/m.76562 type:complete len:261 (-) Transcript_32199:839-1621(-)